MSLRVILTHIVGGEPIRSEHEFENDVVPFGRSPDNLLRLDDAEKQVSSFHGKLEIRDGGCWVTDLGSLNGTLLNGAPLEPKNSMPVKKGDVLAMGSFRIEVVPQQKAAAVEQTIVHLDPRRLAGKFGDQIAARYAELTQLPKEERLSQLRGELRALVISLEPAQARTVLAAISDRFRSPEEDLDEMEATTEASEELLQAGFKVLGDVAKHFLGDRAFKSAAEVASFGRLVRQSLEITCEWVARGLESRREFDEQIGADVTMVCGLERNPLKSQQTAHDIGEFLLDWSAGRNVSAVGASFDNAFRDLHLQQLGLLAGAQQAVDEVLRRLSPDQIEERVKTKGKSFLGIGGAKEWEEFKAAHGELTGSKTRVFDDVVAPAIRKAVRETFDQHAKEPGSGSS